MCGLLFFQAKKDPLSNSLIQLLEKGLSAISHRGPDDTQTFVTEKTFMGHVRLAIRDAAHGRQPYSCGSHSIIFNGEIYNFRSIQRRLEREGVTIDTECDTEIILKSYLQWGDAAFASFRGIWSFVIFDRDQGSWIAARDQFGVKPLYFHLGTDGIYLSSEIKSIIAASKKKFGLAEDRILSFIDGSQLNTNNTTLFSDIMQVPSGHTLRPKNGELELKKIVLDEKIEGENEGFQEQFESHLQRAVDIQIDESETVGLSLSGGLDSSVLAFLASKKSQNLKAYTVSYPGFSFDEARYARSVANTLGIELQIIEPNISDSFDILEMEKMVWYQDQPIPSGSMFAEKKLYETAAQDNVRIIIEGQGSDEFAGGYRSAINMLVASDYFEQGFMTLLLKFGALLFRPSESNISFKKAGKALIRYLQGRIGDFESYRHDLVYVSSLPYQLHSVDRNSMRYSIEARVPFLDDDVCSLLSKAKASDIFDKGWQKNHLRSLLSGRLDDEIVWRRQKVGYASPDYDFFLKNRDELISGVSDYVARTFDKMPQLRRELELRLGSLEEDIKSYSIFYRIFSTTAFYRVHFCKPSF